MQRRAGLEGDSVPKPGRRGLGRVPAAVRDSRALALVTPVGQASGQGDLGADAPCSKPLVPTQLPTPRWGHPRRAVLSLGLAIAAGAHGCRPGCGQVSDRHSPSCLDSCPALRHHPCSWTLWALRGRLRLSPMHTAGGGAVLLSQDSAGEGPGKQSVAWAGPLSQRARWLWRGWGSRTPRCPRTCWTGPGPATVSPVYIELTESSVWVLCACAPAACVYVCECVGVGGPGPQAPLSVRRRRWRGLPCMSHADTVAVHSVPPRSHCSLLFTNPHSPVSAPTPAPGCRPVGFWELSSHICSQVVL